MVGLVFLVGGESISWSGSDPVVIEQRRKGQTFCKMCGQRGHSLRSCVKVRSCDELLEQFFVKD